MLHILLSNSKRNNTVAKLNGMPILGAPIFDHFFRGPAERCLWEMPTPKRAHLGSVLVFFWLFRRIFFRHERHMGSHFVLNLSVALSSTCGRHGIRKWRSGVEFGHQLGPGLAPSLPAEHESTRQVGACFDFLLFPSRATTRRRRTFELSFASPRIFFCRAALPLRALCPLAP